MDSTELNGPAYPSGIPTPIFRVLVDLLGVIEDESAKIRDRRDADAKTLDDLAALAECIGASIDEIETPPAADVEDWPTMSRAEAVSRYLGVCDGPVDRATITARLVSLGRDDTVEQVSSTLNYLHRQGRIVAVGDGWAIAAREPASV